MYAEAEENVIIIYEVMRSGKVIKRKIEGGKKASELIAGEQM